MQTVPAPWTTALLAAALLAAPVLGVVAPLALAPVCAVLGVAALAEGFRHRALFHLGWRHLGFAALLILWAAVSLAWAPGPRDGALTLVRVAALVPAGLAAIWLARHTPARSRPLLTLALLAGGAVTVALLAGEGLSGNGLTGGWARLRGMEALPEGYKSPLNRGATVLAILMWPAAALAWRVRGRAWGAVCGLAGAGTLIVGDSMGAHAALLLGVVAFACVWAAPRVGLLVLRIGMVATILGLPLAVQLLPTPPESVHMARWLASSGHHRLAIWHFAAERIAERPVLGWGMDASRAIPGGEDMINVVVVEADGNEFPVIGQLMPLHPHNAVLQWWLELGAVGTLLMAALLWRVTGLIASPWAAATFASAFTVALVSYGWWQNWWQACLWLAAALCALAASTDHEAAR